MSEALAPLRLAETDEFRFGLWWVSNGCGSLRSATTRECATEIIRLRDELRYFGELAKQDHDMLTAEIAALRARLP